MSDAKLHGVYNSATIKQVGDERTLKLTSERGYVELVTSPGELTCLRVTNLDFGSSFEHLDLNALKLLAYELNLKIERAKLQSRIYAHSNV